MQVLHVRRSYLVRRVEEYTVEFPDDLDVAAWKDADPAAFDEAVCDNDADTEDYEAVEGDDDELTTEILG